MGRAPRSILGIFLLLMAQDSVIQDTKSSQGGEIQDKIHHTVGSMSLNWGKGHRYWLLSLVMMPLLFRVICEGYGKYLKYGW